ncbi:hypothetical protein AB837_00495 [bacterium AB1]|nr:hypothetical protein AB837_00495 [bacterium AB1]
MVVENQKIKKQKIISYYNQIKCFLQKNKAKFSQESIQLYDETLSILSEIQKTVKCGLSHISDDIEGQTHIKNGELCIDQMLVKGSVFQQAKTIDYQYNILQHSQVGYLSFVNHLIMHDVNGIKSEYLQKKKETNQTYLDNILKIFNSVFTDLSISTTLNIQKVHDKIVQLNNTAIEEHSLYEVCILSYLDTKLKEQIFQQYFDYQTLQRDLLDNLKMIEFLVKNKQSEIYHQTIRTFKSISDNLLDACLPNMSDLFQQKDGKLLVDNIEVVNINSCYYSQYLSFLQDAENHEYLYNYLAKKIERYHLSLFLYNQKLKCLFDVIDKEGADLQEQLKTLHQLILHQKQEDSYYTNLIDKEFQNDLHSRILDIHNKTRA